MPVFHDCQALHEAGAVLGVGCLCCLQKDVDRGHWGTATLADIMDFTINIRTVLFYLMLYIGF